MTMDGDEMALFKEAVGFSNFYISLKLHDSCDN